MAHIYFRGKRMDGTWVYGLPNYRIFGGLYESICSIETLPGNRYSVNPDTVCQSIGLYGIDENDCRGDLIFEGDIVELKTRGGTIDRYLIWWCKEMSMMTAVSLDRIEFNGCDYWDGGPNAIEYSTFCLMMQDPYGDFEYIKVIGNVHDNPELIQCK